MLRETTKKDDWTCWDWNQMTMLTCVAVENKTHLIQGCIMGKNYF